MFELLLHNRQQHLAHTLTASMGAALLCIFLNASPAAAQSTADRDPAVVGTTAGRPRIGLVLGGGGARGAAHVGVLQELERMRIPIDVIVGTSMGAVVGGLYASGMTAAELETTVTTLDWADALSDRPARKDLSFRRKQEDEQFPINFEVGYRDGQFQFPQGLIQGHALGLVLRELTIHASDIRDFDDLPVPFRAIASDIVSGDIYVMGEGDLAVAIRASMSVPGVFAPVPINDRLLVDGGLVGNLAVNVMQEMDVDIIIAVNVEFPLYDVDELTSPLAISEQMLTMLMRKETLRQIESLGPRDILISPDLGKFSSGNFQRAVETIEPGAEATRAVAARLSELSVSEHAYAEYLAKRTKTTALDGDLAFVRVVHDATVASEILESRMDIKAGDPIDLDSLAQEANRLYGLRLFEKVGYRLIASGTETGVEFNAQSKSWGPNYLRFGISLEEDFEGSTAFNLSTRLRQPELNTLGAELVTDLRIGTDPLLATEFYQPLRFDSRLFVAPSIAIWQEDLNAFVMNDAVARLRISEVLLQIDVGAEIGNVGEIRMGLYRGAGQGRVKVGNPAIPNFKFETGGFEAGLRFDTFDNAQFPKRGVRADLLWNSSLPQLGADARFDTVAFDISTALSRGRNTLVVGLDVGITLDSASSIQDHFPLGGFLRLSGLKRGQIIGPHAALTRLVYYRQMNSPAGGLLQFPFYLGGSIEAGNTWQSRSDISVESLLINGSLFLGMDTTFGPLYLAVGFAENGETNLYLFFGTTP